MDTKTVTTAVTTPTEVKSPKQEIKKFVVAQSQFVADALKRKVPAFADATVILEYKDIRNKLLGAEVLGTQMDVSLADVAQVFHQCTLPKSREEIEVLAKTEHGAPVIDALMWAPRTFTVKSLSYSKWTLQNMESPQGKLELQD